MDKITIEIKADGTVVSTTDKISALNHSGTEGFFTFLAGKLGGAFARRRRAGAQHHEHDHEHTHEGGETHSH
jgi:hypothetical protein